MKRIFIFIALSLLVFKSYSQSIESYTHAIDFLPPPPNATAIMKHDALAINKNTGSPNINIPLMPLKGLKLNLGASIGYASTGLKVDEIASRVGMGWTIQLGGVVTRTVRGAPDEKAIRLSAPSFSDDCGTYNYFQNANRPVGPDDTEPDYFTFSMNGLSGSFVLDNNMNPVIISGQKYKIEYDLTNSIATWNFKITDDRGIVYYFGGTRATEKTIRQSTCGPRNFASPLPVSWYLIKIQHPNGETINLGYTAITYSYDTGYSETQQWRYEIPNTDFADPSQVASFSCPYCDPVGDTYCVSHVNTTGVKLTSVNTNAGYSMGISYTARTDCNDQLIDGIIYYGPDGTTIGSYGLVYNMVQSNLLYANSRGTYTGYDKTPYLRSLTESAAGGAAVSQHLFTYLDPANRAPRLSLAQDHWGYFNGMMDNRSFIPTPSSTMLINDFPRATANREPQEQYTMKGMLCKIQYPTGGSDTIIYEPNKQAHAAAQPTHVFYGQTTGSGDHTNMVNTYTLTIPASQNVSFHFTCDSSGLVDHLHNVGDFTIIGGGTTVTHQTLSPGQSLDMNFNLSGTYTLQVQANGATVISRAIATYHASTMSGALVNAPTAGLRVKSVITSAQGQTAQIRRYFYGELSTMSLSSLVNVPDPVYNVDTRTANNCTMQETGTGLTFPYTGTCTGIAMHSNSQRNLYDFAGSPISYVSVIESIGPNFEGGGTQNRFFSEHDAAGQIVFGHDIPNATYSNFSINYNGKTREETLLKKITSGALIPIKTTLYTYKSDTTGRRTISGYAVQMDYFKSEQLAGCTPTNVPVAPPYLDPFSAVRYDIMAPWIYNDTLTVKTYDANGLNPIISTTVNKFENAAHRQLTYRQTNTSDGHLDVVKFKYPIDYGATPVYASMIAANIISPVLDMTAYKDTAKMAEQKINYADWGNGNYEMASAQSSFYSAPLLTDGNIDSYNKYGNITQYTGKDKLTTAILWGGKRGQYPVAKIAGSAYATAVSHMSVADTVLYAMNETDTRTQIDLIRAALPNAQVTTYTYKQKVGVTSITDPRDNMSSYVYDYKDRMNSIFDVNGNIVKNYSYNFGIPTPDNTTGYVGNDYMQNSFTAASCEPGFSALAINYGIAANSFFGATKADANSAAAATLQSQGQSYANQFSTCTANQPVYWNDEQHQPFQRTNCDANYTGTYVTYSIPAHTYSGPTPQDANQLALYYLNQGGAAYANANGACNPNCTTGNCSGNDKKCMNGVCETGQKIYTSSVQQHASLWTCTYHYRWSDGSISVDYTESSGTNCVTVED